MLCSAAASAMATDTAEQVTAIEPDGSVQLETSGKASFANIRIIDTTLAKDWLTQHVLQQTISFESGETDRYGRIIITSDIEEKMLREGIALIYASGEEIPAAWTNAEAIARGRHLGIWSGKHLVLTPENAAQHENAFHVVEGRIMRIYETKAATYLNFGKDWHTDFSVTIPAKLRRSMGDKLVDIKEGDNVRVRGRIYEQNGPMILLTHADNLEKY